MGLGNYRKNQHSSNLLSRRSSTLQLHSGWCTVIAVVRICASMAASDRQSGARRDLSGRERGERGLSAISRTRRTLGRNAVAQSFSVAREFCRCGLARADRVRRARADHSRIRAARTDAGVHGSDPLVQPYRAHDDQRQRLKHDPSRCIGQIWPMRLDR
jgi:hypothetical protein